MLKKRMCGLLLSGGLVLGALAMPVSAANTEDTPYEFVFDASSTSYNTAQRSKTNSSSIYVKLENAPVRGIRCLTFGHCPSGNAGEMLWQNKTVGGIVMLYRGQWRIRQTIYESGGRSAYLYFKKYQEDGVYEYVKGVWSPDCAGSYTYAN